MLSGTFPFGISRLRNLKYLNLAENNLHGFLPEDLFSSSLEFIGLSTNFFHGPIPNYFPNNGQLMEFYAAYNLFSGTVPSWIKEAKHLKTFLASHNILSGTISDDFVHSLRLERCKCNSNLQYFRRCLSTALLS